MLHIIHATTARHLRGDFISDSEINLIFKPLKTAIKLDRNLFIKAKFDPIFDNVRPHVEVLLEDIFQETKKNAEKQVSNAEFAVQKMKKWFDGDYASNDDKQKYNLVRNEISDAKGKLRTQSYFNYDDALKIMTGVNQMIDELRRSIKQNLENLEKQVENAQKKINYCPEKINQIKIEKQKETKNYLFYSFGSFILFKLSYNLFILEKYPIFSWIQILEPLGDILGGLIGIIIMLIIFVGGLAGLLGGLPATIIFLFLAIESFFNIFNAEELGKINSEKKELVEIIDELENRISIANELLTSP